MATDDTEEKDSSPQNQKDTSLSNGSGNLSGGELNLSFVPDEPKRRVSIASDAIQADIDKKSKISVSSHDSRFRSILVNGDGFRHSIDGDKLGSQYKDVDSIKKFTYDSFEHHDVRNSWWYDLCTKCRRKETGAGWEPSFWSFLCPYPFCPTYRHVARCIALLCLGSLTWGIIYSVIGEDIAPGGQLFDIAVLCILAHLGGWLFRLINLPALVGMLLVGAIYQNVGLINIHGGYAEFVSILRRIALVMILTRAGLDLDPKALKRLFCTVLRLGLIPWITECVTTMVLTHYFFGFPWIWGLLCGSIVAAVAPAVVVPCLFRIRNKGYGVSKGIPTLVIAVSGIDDAASVAAFGIIYGIMFSPNSLAFNLVMGPMSIGGGILFGVLWGFLAKYIPERDDPFAVPLRILMLLGGGLLAVMGSESIGMGGAGPLGCITAAFASIYVWSKQGWEIEDNPVATAYEIFWMIFEPILFGLTGTQIKLKEIHPDTFGIAMAILVIGIVLRIIVTILTGIGASLNTKEKVFVAISWMAKASVQAALSPIPLDSLKNEKGSPDYKYAEIILMLCVLSIILTAPLGAIIITLTGTKLLKKTTSVVSPEGWRRSHRPSLRDIQVNDDDDDDDDDDKDNSDEDNISIKDKTFSKPPIDRITPSVVITTQP